MQKLNRLKISTYTGCGLFDILLACTSIFLKEKLFHFQVWNDRSYPFIKTVTYQQGHLDYTYTVYTEKTDGSHGSESKLYIAGSVLTQSISYILIE